MEQKREIKVSLSIVVCVFIILVLLVALGVVYYLGFVKNDNANEDVTEKNNISVNEQVPEVNNNVEEKLEEEKVEDNGSEQGLNKNKGKEAISLIAKEDTKFVINEIKNNGDTYIISANILEKEAKKISEQEYKSILEGQEITFRNIKWKYDKDTSSNDIVYLKAIGNYNNISYTPMLALIYNINEKTGYFSNTAGVKAELCDYLEEIEFDVSNDIKVCSYWGEFEYINGELICTSVDNGNTEAKTESIDYLMNFINNNKPGVYGSYEECIAYVSNGNVDAIKIFNK